MGVNSSFSCDCLQNVLVREGVRLCASCFVWGGNKQKNGICTRLACM